jgi:hypothetical protein
MTADPVDVNLDALALLWCMLRDDEDGAVAIPGRR